MSSRVLPDDTAEPDSESGTTETRARSFEQVYRDHAARVFRCCLSQVGNRGDAEDLAADVFAAAFHAYAGTADPKVNVEGEVVMRDEVRQALAGQVA